MISYTNLDQPTTHRRSCINLTLSRNVFSVVIVPLSLYHSENEAIVAIIDGRIMVP